MGHSLPEALRLLQGGQLAAAETTCRQVLSRHPRDPAAIHLLGLIRKDAGDVAACERLMRESIAIEPRSAEFRANLASLLRRLGRMEEAEACYRDALALDPRNRAARLSLARTLVDLGRPGDAEAECRTLIASGTAEAAVWSLLATALRSQHRLEESEAAFRRAIEIDPRQGAAHHNLGALLSQLERAGEALQALQQARQRGVSGFELEFNSGRALMQLTRLDEAERAFEAAVALQPLHVEAQLNLARLRWLRGDADFARSVRAAAAAHPDDVAIQMLFGRVLWRAGDLAGAEALLRDLLARRGSMPQARSMLAMVLFESGRPAEAQHEALEAARAQPGEPTVDDPLVSILLARGLADEAMPYILGQRARQPNEQLWIAHEATAARLLGKALYEELYDYDRVVRKFELETPKGWSSMQELNAAAIEALAKRHVAATHPLDQSLRHGTQTLASLLTDPDPAIRALIKAFEGPIESYRALIGTDAAHPLSARNTAPARLAGAWSVRLQKEGFHVNHVHPEGWISSAYYVSVPAEVADDAQMSGWIKFGEPRIPTPGATAERYIRPSAGSLVLFPSYMWHGTNAIHGNDARITIAFDAVPARSG
ncbi:MAG TPA: tetratricopeptide repeat protein [Steroidobacteraceae bacterium]|nr:tetratricopeptide repeat protein [Steroidobacteraceae bacterium]